MTQSGKAGNPRETKQSARERVAEERRAQAAAQARRDKLFRGGLIALVLVLVGLIAHRLVAAGRVEENGSATVAVARAARGRDLGRPAGRSDGRRRDPDGHGDQTGGRPVRGLPVPGVQRVRDGHRHRRPGRRDVRQGQGRLPHPLVPGRQPEQRLVGPRGQRCRLRSGPGHVPGVPQRGLQEPAGDRGRRVHR